MMCDKCRATADYDQVEIAGKHLTVQSWKQALATRPGHCDDPTCTCQHRPSGSVKFDTGKK